MAVLPEDLVMTRLSIAFVLLVAVHASSASGAATPAPRDTLDRVVPLPGIEVSTTRPDALAPGARSVMTREDAQRQDWGQDTPMALQSMPGAYAYSDAGNGIGYSYLSVRGFPQRRISVLVNGVPLNDPESHEVYWIDHPDLLASTSEVQVQRGVGSALYGAASLGGSVNVETGPFHETASGSALVAAGAWGTRRLMVEMGSGQLAGGWNLYGRYSRIETDGYRDQSDSRLWSYSLAARREWRSQALRVNLYGGPEETHLAYLGVPSATLDGGLTGDPGRDRRYNPITYPGERDHFFEPHYEIIHSWAPSPAVALTQTLFWFDGRGYYDEQRFGLALTDYRLSPIATTDSTLAPRDYYAQNPDGSLATDGAGKYTLERFDLVRRRTVENRHYGWVPRARFEQAHGTLTVGGELRAHDGRHYGEVVSGVPLPPGTPADARYYDYHPRTLAAGLFAREEWRAAATLRVTADLAWRHQAYHMRDDKFDGIAFDQTYDFALPRLGLTWDASKQVRTYVSWAYSSREPAFRDLYDAEGPGNLPLYGTIDVANGIYSDPLIRPEHVNDWEAGATWSGAAASVTANLFRMDFHDELVYAGQFDTDLGYPILGNAARSVHQGVELSARGERAIAGGPRVTVDANATLSDNHFVEYHEVYGTTEADVVSYDGNALGFFPATLGNLSARADWRRLGLTAEAHYAGRIYLDNTESRSASIDPRTTLDLIAVTRAPLVGVPTELTVRVMNALDTRYSTGGYVDYDATGALVPMFIPAATRGWMAEMRVHF
jgi:iron complex outermembrane recepter protein